MATLTLPLSRWKTPKASNAGRTGRWLYCVDPGAAGSELNYALLMRNFSGETTRNPPVSD